MKRYNKYNKKKQSRREKIGFFTAFSVCMVAIGLALWSTYASIGGLSGNTQTESTYSASLGDMTKPVNRQVTGITLVESLEELDTTSPETEIQTEPTETESTTAQEFDEQDKLQTILQIPTSLLYPVSSQRVMSEYSEQAVQNKTMGDYRPHTGTDFKADIDENVFAVCDGIVDDISIDDMYGTIVKITNSNFSVYYCGMGEEPFCAEGDAVEAGDVIGKVGVVPCESEEESHIHMEVRVNGNPIDPMTVISNNR